MPEVVKFGLDQVNNPTPIGLKWALRIFQFLTGVWGLLPQDMLPLSEDDYMRACKWLLVANAVMLFGIKFFGLDYKPRD